MPPLVLILLPACGLAPAAVPTSKAAPEAHPRTCAQALAAGDDRSILAIDPDGSGSPIRVSCDMETAGGGWTLVLHLTRSAGLQEDDFLDLFGHNRFTDETWTYEVGTGDVVAGVNGGLMSMLTQGALDIRRFDGAWSDVRMACSNDDLDPEPDHWAQVDDYAAQTGSSLLLGATANGTVFTVDPATNSMGLDWLSHDNELTTGHGHHYLCDTTNTEVENPAPQFGFCYTAHLTDPNEQDSGDSVVALSFGETTGSDTWSEGFTAECGPTGGALQNAGTTWIWIR